MTELLECTERRILKEKKAACALTSDRFGFRDDSDDYASSNKIFQHDLSFNLIPHIDSFQENGYTKEEMKVAWETRKIFASPEMKISTTAVRIPILRAHSEAITLELAKPVDVERAKELIDDAPGVRLVDDPASLKYPMPLSASNSFDVEAGRVRRSLAFDNGLDLFVCGDQLLRGAALNAVLIAKRARGSSSTKRRKTA